MEPRNYLNEEAMRNKRNVDAYASLIRSAFGANEAVLVGHHICFQRESDFSTENEIPSADTLIFDHDVMTATFGDRALPIMAELAVLPLKERDQRLRAYHAEVTNGGN